jgi:hypothetical protein
MNVQGLSPRPVAVLTALLMLVAVAAGCNDNDGGGDAARSEDVHSTESGATPTPTPGDPTLITGTGTIRHLDLEGGFWGIVADDSTRYDPGTIDERFQHDGMRVRFDLRRNEGQMSIRQWGTLVTVVRLDSL